MKGLIALSVCFGIQTLCVAQGAQKSVHKNQPDLASSSKPHAVVDYTASSVEVSTDSQPLVKVNRMAPAGVDINYLPLFGKYEKTETQQVNDELFKSDCDKEFKTRKEASQFFTKMAWQYLSEGDRATAVYRFNLAYVLNPDNLDVYWGLGVMEFQDEKLTEAIELMDKGLKLSDGKNYVFMTDLATIYLKKALQNNSDVLDNHKAKDLLLKVIEIQPQYTPAFVQLSISNVIDGDLNAAWDSFHKAYELNPAEISKEVLNELLARKEDPKGIFKK